MDFQRRNYRPNVSDQCMLSAKSRTDDYSCINKSNNNYYYCNKTTTVAIVLLACIYSFYLWPALTEPYVDRPGTDGQRRTKPTIEKDALLLRNSKLLSSPISDGFQLLPYSTSSFISYSALSFQRCRVVAWHLWVIYLAYRGKPGRQRYASVKYVVSNMTSIFLH